jgi:hypothetical protein
MKPILWAVLGVSLALAGCSQPLEGPGPGRDSTVPDLGITSFSVAGVKGEIVGTTIYVRDVPLYTTAKTLTDLRNATPAIGYKGGTLSPVADIPQDFSTPKIYTLIMDDGSQWDYTVVVTVQPLTSAAEIAVYLPIAAKVYAGTEAAPIPVPVGMELSTTNWRDILSAIRVGGLSVALDLSACTVGIDTAGGGLYGDYTFDPGPAHTGENMVVSLVLPDAATKIAPGATGAPAFKRFTTLGSVVGAGVTEVGHDAFSDCTSLTTVSFPTATTIGFDAFSGCAGLTRVSLPTARIIGEAAFFDCDALTTVNLPAATSIGQDTFSDCAALISVSFPAAASISAGAFYGCTALKELDLPVATTIGINAFNGCDALEEVYLPGATSIGNFAFADCDALRSLNLPIVRTIDSRAFFSCDNLSSLNLPSVRTISDYAFGSCEKLSSLNLPAARTISDYAFSYCPKLVSVDLPAVKTIGGSAFYECPILNSVDLPTATTIGGNVFAYCTALSSVNLPSVTTINGGVFSNTGTVTLTVTLGASPPWIGRNIFPGVGSAKTVTIKVPDTSAYGTPLTMNGNDTTPCLANGFRGGGWDNGNFVSGGSVNTNIKLTIEEYTTP